MRVHTCIGQRFYFIHSVNIEDYNKDLTAMICIGAESLIQKPVAITKGKLNVPSRRIFRTGLKNYCGHNGGASSLHSSTFL